MQAAQTPVSLFIQEPSRSLQRGLQTCQEPPAEEQMLFPWRPSTVEGLSHHASTQLDDGRLSMIVDPGAWANMLGSSTAWKLRVQAMPCGYEPNQLDMAMMILNGGGKSPQGTDYRLVCPIAVPLSEGTDVHQLTAPVVDGDGAKLLGLLGFRSLEHGESFLMWARRNSSFQDL